MLTCWTDAAKVCLHSSRPRPFSDMTGCWLQVNSCKRNMNTFAFVGDLEKSPEVSCVYHSEDAENQVSPLSWDGAAACSKHCTTAEAMGWDRQTSTVHLPKAIMAVLCL